MALLCERAANFSASCRGGPGRKVSSTLNSNLERVTDSNHVSVTQDMRHV